MTSFDEQTRADARAALHQQQKTERDDAVATASARGREAARLKALADNPEWKWFRDTHLIPLVQTEHDAALDTMRSASDRNDSAHRHAAARQVVDMLENKCAEATEAAQSAFAAIPKE